MTEFSADDIKKILSNINELNKIDSDIAVLRHECDVHSMEGSCSKLEGLKYSRHEIARIQRNIMKM